MLYVVGAQEGELHCASYTVVSAEGCPVSTEPLAVNVCLDGIVHEVYLLPVETLADHIHV